GKLRALLGDGRADSDRRTDLLERRPARALRPRPGGLRSLSATRVGRQLAVPFERKLEAPRPKSLRYAMHAGVLFAVLGFFRLFPLDAASALGGWFGRALIAPLRRNRPKTIETLRIAYPDLDDEEARELLTGTYEHMGRIVAEIAHGDDFTGMAGRRRFTFE